jgi:polyferredoxin
MRLDARDMSLEKLVKKWYKHFLWIGFSIWTGFTFVGYFTPIRDLGMEFFLGQYVVRGKSFGCSSTALQLMATQASCASKSANTCALMRAFKAPCLTKTPSSSPMTQSAASPEALVPTKHDLTDARIWALVWTAVCAFKFAPRGIDIRKGLQYECIGCGACADVCDTVMDKVGYARGLVKYSTQHAMQNHWSSAQTLRHIFRPRVLIYTGILLLVVALLFGSFLTRKSFKVDVVERSGHARPHHREWGNVENVLPLANHECS